MTSSHDIGPKLVLIAVLVAVVVAISVFFGENKVKSVPPEQKTSPSFADNLRQGIVKPPEYASTTRMKLEKSFGFQHLVSYTENGFEPTVITIKNGETVRFTNNSGEPLWIAAVESDESLLYPAVQNGCGSSALDSCSLIATQDFWEFTFTHSGSWKFTNILNRAEGGTVLVKSK
jgi:plastocyanin